MSNITQLTDDQEAAFRFFCKLVSEGWSFNYSKSAALKGLSKTDIFYVVNDERFKKIKRDLKYKQELRTSWVSGSCISNQIKTLSKGQQNGLIGETKALDQATSQQFLDLIHIKP